MEFIRYNNNPKSKRTGDCVVRAIALVTNRSWEAIYSELAEQGIKEGLMPNSRENWKKYLKKLGYEMQKMPKKENGKRFTIEEFANQLAKENKTYIIKVAKHLTVVKNKNLYDTWNCSTRCVGNYWIIEREQ